MQDGQPAYGQPQYASDQGQPSGYYAPTPVTRPPAIDKAVMLMKVGAALSIISGLLSLTMRSAYREISEKALRDGSQPVTAENIDLGTNMALGFAIASGLIGAALWWWMAVMNNKGKSWARILSTIFFGISVLSFVYGLSTGTPMLGIVLSVLSLLVGAGAVWFMWQKESTNYYEAASRTA